MLAFTLRRAIQAIGVMIAVGIISFSMFRFAGDPVNQIVGIDTPAAERAEIRKSLGLDDPVPVQFVRYLGNAVQFKFGVSYSSDNRWRTCWRTGCRQLWNSRSAPPYWRWCSAY